MAIPQTIKDLANKVRTAVYGKDVRESLAKSMEETGNLADETKTRQDSLETQFQTVLDETTGKDVVSAPEILAARGSHPNLKDRLDTEHTEVMSSLAQLTTKTNKSQTLVVSKTGQYKTITEAVDYAKANGVSRINRFVIEICPGEYNEKLVLADGIDLIGEDSKNTTIRYNGSVKRADDTIYAPYDCLIKNLTVIQDAYGNTSDLQNYPIHVDGNNVEYKLRLENVLALALGEWCHHAIGFGLHGNQSVEIKNCTFKSDSKPAFYLHNQPNQTTAMSCIVDNSLIFGCVVMDMVGTGKSAVLLEDVNSGKIDEVKFNNTEIYSFGGTDVKLQKHPSFSGTRNTLICSLKNCRYETMSHESDSGSIVDLDRGFFVTGPTAGSRGNPLLSNGAMASMGKVIPAKVSDIDNSPAILGVASNYGKIVFCVTSGVTEAIVDGTVPIAAGDYLASKSNSAYQKGTVGSGACNAIALEPWSGGFKMIKVLMIPPR